jgi:peptidyl-prolyl cis-trans isomerase D
MSVIQKIRDKYARWAVIAIAVSLIGFILMDAFTGRSRLFGGGSTTTLGTVNGNKIDQLEFENKVKSEEQNRQAQGETARQGLIEQLWNQEVGQVLLNEEYKKLGITVGKRELTDMFYGPDPSPVAKQYLSNPDTKQYDVNQVQQIISQINRGKDATRKAQLAQLADAMETDRRSQKYTTLLAGSIHYARWFLEKQNVDNSLLAKVAYVVVPYQVISDSLKELAVSDKEIQDYVDKHKERFTIDDEFRTVAYTSFNAAPSSADTLATLQQAEKLKQEFETTTDPGLFVSRNASAFEYDSAYHGKSKIQVPARDSIFKLAKNQVYGPYLDNNNFVLAKMLDEKQLPDTVKVRHILLGTRNPQSGQMIMEDSVAKQKADSIEKAIAGGAKFDSLEAKYSTDEAAHKDKGVMSFSSDQIQGENFAKEFGQFILFDGKPGDKKVVKTDFGYHYIEILEYKNAEPHYRIAYFAKRIDVSNETDQNANNAAMQFAGEAHDIKSFDAAVEKRRGQGVQKLFAPDIKSHAAEIVGVGEARQFIKKLFNADKGDVLGPEHIGDKYIVAVVTEINPKGVASVAKVRPYVEPVLRNKKKAAIIKKKIGNVSSLESVVTAATQQFPSKDTIRIQTADSVRFSSRDNSPLAYEGVVVGASFNPANNGKVVSQLLEGSAGVYALRVDNTSATVVDNADIKAGRKSMETQARMSILFGGQSQFGGFGGQSFDPAAVLRKTATIKDYRNKFY